MTTIARIEKGISHIELGHLSFDQWNLALSIRKYSGDEVVGMAKLVFPGVRGFRYLDEGDMLQYPYPEGAHLNYFSEVKAGGWLLQEAAFGNITTPEGCKEYLISTDNECVCVLSHENPILLRLEGEPAV